ncbi:hypothetical protein [Nannocystis punicea]|uniref:Uncharacterized protein n=1 Tax=Nannocystis punicea TaxID=2995304 RepID=A0ABY7HJR9_9BACT|nr:hypothetical protein [Nannocystis poenicansa]WAS99184.1 hypothetical protein O0S08_23905 [Nannocystis poenicansa]
MAAHRYFTFGISHHDLAGARALVERRLNLPLQERESSYYGGTYDAYRAAFGRKAMLYANFDADREIWIRAAHRGFPVLLEISDLEDMDAIRLHLQGDPDVVLLREKRSSRPSRRRRGRCLSTHCRLSSPLELRIARYDRLSPPACPRASIAGFDREAPAPIAPHDRPRPPNIASGVPWVPRAPS